MPLIPIRLKELTPTSGNTQGRLKKPSCKRVGLIGKENESAKESHDEQPQGKADGKDKTLSM
jgi:hypothetical protein